MNFYDKLLNIKKEKKLTNTDIGAIIGMSGDAFRMASKRESLSDLQMKEIEKYFEQKTNKSNIGGVELSNTDEEIEVFINKNGIKFYEYPDGSTKIEVLKIPFDAYASYLEVFNDDEKLYSEFSKSTFTVDKVAKGNYLAFNIKNDSMNGGGINDTPSGAEVLARELGKHLWNDGFHNSDYGFILMTKNAICHKDIKNYDRETGNLTLSSRNPTEKEFEISINDVYRIFKVIKRTF
jgi:hypothetical protein